MGEIYYSRFNFFIVASGCKGIPTIPGYMLAIFLTMVCEDDKKQVNFQGYEEGVNFPLFFNGFHCVPTASAFFYLPCVLVPFFIILLIPGQADSMRSWLRGGGVSLSDDLLEARGL